MVILGVIGFSGGGGGAGDPHDRVAACSLLPSFPPSSPNSFLTSDLRPRVSQRRGKCLEVGLVQFRLPRVRETCAKLS